MRQWREIIKQMTIRARRPLLGQICPPQHRHAAQTLPTCRPPPPTPSSTCTHAAIRKTPTPMCRAWWIRGRTLSTCSCKLAVRCRLRRSVSANGTSFLSMGCSSLGTVPRNSSRPLTSWRVRAWTRKTTQLWTVSRPCSNKKIYIEIQTTFTQKFVFSSLLWLNFTLRH